MAATEMVSAMAAYDPYWIEEPIFPPEDFDALARLRMETGVRLAAGENACTSFQFQAMFDAGAVDFAQPSVTKVGGITEFQKITALAETAGVQIMAHSPYFVQQMLHLASTHRTCQLCMPTLGCFRP